jgi:CBS domain-containing protein
MKVNEIMTRDAVSVEPNTPVSEAVRIMADKDMGAIVVQIEGPSFGIFTEHDLLARVVAGGKDPETTKIRDVMTRSIKCAQAEDDVEDILRIMYHENVQHLPVMDKRRLVGIVSMTDLFKFTFRASEGYAEEVI